MECQNEKRFLTEKNVGPFAEKMETKEKSQATIVKYTREVRLFIEFLGDRELTQDVLLEWKRHLRAMGYKAKTVNTKLAALNTFLRFMNWGDFAVQYLRIEKEIFANERRHLTFKEYERLVAAAADDPQTQLFIETICSTGILVSELKYIRVEDLENGIFTVENKGKIRKVGLVKKMIIKLLAWAKKNNITSGPIFVTRNGKPLDRGTIWARMKALSKKANVLPSKVFPHNLRKVVRQKIL